MDDQGLHDAAIMLMSLGEEEAAEVFKHFSPKEVQKLGETIARMRSVSREKVDEVINKFSNAAAAQSLLVSDTGNYVRAVLKRALGDDKAGLLIDRILQGGDVSGIESLKWMDPLSVAELLRNEHPQIVAAILVHLDSDQASGILMHLTDRQRSEILLRVATLEGIQPTALKDLNEVLFKVLAGGDKIRKSSLGGVKAAAEIINLLGGNMDAVVLESIRGYDPDLAQKIMTRCSCSRMFSSWTTRPFKRYSRKWHPKPSSWLSRAQCPNCAKNSFPTCLRVQPTRCAKTSNRAARCGCPRSRRSRRKSSRRCVACLTKARS